MNNYFRQSYRSCTRNGATNFVQEPFSGWLRSGDRLGTAEDLEPIEQQPLATGRSATFLLLLWRTEPRQIGIPIDDPARAPGIVAKVSCRLRWAIAQARSAR